MVIPSFRPVVGGAELRTERLCRKLLERGIRVVVLTRRYPGLAYSETIGGVPIYRLGHPSRQKLGALSFALHALWLVTRLGSYSIVHVQSQDAPLLVGMLARVLLGRTLVVTVRSDPDRFWGRLGWWRSRLFPKVVDVVAGLSPNMVHELVASGLPRDRVVGLHSGVDMLAFRPATPAERREARARLGIENGTAVFLFVGRLDEVKGLDSLLQAWSRAVSNTHRRLLLVGDGPQRDLLGRMVRDLDLGDVTLEGETQDVVRYLHAADVFVLPSLSEGLPNALLEAMSAGLASLVSDAHGNRAVVQDRVTGLIFPPGDVPALARGLRALEDSSLRVPMGERARAAIQSRYSLESSIQAHVDLYTRLDVTRKGRRVP